MLDELGGSGSNLIGGKAYGLLRLRKFGFPTPKTAVVTTDAYQAYVRERGLSEVRARGRSPEQQTRALRESFVLRPLAGDSKVLSKLMLQLRRVLPKLGFGRDTSSGVAVRSSATLEDSELRSFAGAFYTALNVRTIDALSAAILKCWASVWQRGFLRKASGDMPELKMAVVIQEMINPDVSGVTFTDVASRPGSVLIEASWGLGKGIVDGTVNPDTAIVDLTEGTVEYRLGTKAHVFRALEDNGIVKETAPQRLRERRCLSDGMAIWLAHQCAMAQESFGYPLDIEWSMTADRVTFLQARPLVKVRRPSSVGVSRSPVKRRPLASEFEEQSRILSGSV